MWRLWNKLFGWHYVAVQYGYSHHPRRVMVDGDGRPYVTVCGEIIDLQDRSERWRALTFPRALILNDGKPAEVVHLPIRH